MVNDPISPAEVKNEMIWFNDFIKCNNKPLFEENMYKNGVRCIGDIVNNTGRCMQFAEFQRKYPGVSMNYLRYLGIVSAIPALWKTRLKQGVAETVNDERGRHPRVAFNGKQTSILKMRTKDYYKIRVENNRVKPTAVNRWEEERIVPSEWKQVFRIPYTCTKSTKFQSFQYQIIHRYIPTRKFLFVRHIVDSPKCNQCNDVDTISHHFLGCPRVTKFWDELFTYLSKYFKNMSKLDLNVILFGMLSGPPVLNLLIILGKHYVHSCSANQRPLIFNNYLSYVEDMRDIERRAAAEDLNLITAFRRKWQVFLDDSLTDQSGAINISS